MMNFFVSGQPKLGHESWPPPTDDKVLSDRLYGQRGANENTRMEIRFEKVGDKLITYYHFSKLKNVTSSLTDEEKKNNPFADHGRKGSFFVMSLRIDGYYSTDFSKIYSMLEELYENYVNGKVLKLSKEGYLVYQIMKLEEAKEVWEKITSEIEARGETTFLKQTKPIPSDISINGTKTSDYFSVEDAEKSIESVLIQKGGVFVLSLEEMNARNEEIKQQEKKTNVETPNGEGKTGHKKEAFIKATEDVQDLTSTIDDTISQKIKNLVQLLTRRNTVDKEWLEKLTSLSEEQESLIERINAIGGRFQIPSHKKDLVKGTWLPIALIVIGLIDLWLFKSLINTKREVSALVEQIDSLTVHRCSTTYEMKMTPESEQEDVNEMSEEVPHISHEAEIAEITLLDLRKTDNTDVSKMEKGNSYVVTAKTGSSGNRVEAKGTGKYSCDKGSDDGVILSQNGNKCNITILEDAGATKIKLTYEYQLGDLTKSFKKEIKIKNKTRLK